jgi:hypothetical protein
MQLTSNLIEAFEHEDRSFESDRSSFARRPATGANDWARFGQRSKGRKEINGAHRRSRKRICA